MPKKEAKAILKAVLEAPSLPREGPMRSPPHMGDFIRTEILEPLGLTVSAAAKILGVGRPALSNLLNGKANLSPEMALRIEKAFGPEMDHLMRMQLSYDLARMRARAGEIKVTRYAA
jgi:addiction module HigA family antidote